MAKLSINSTLHPYRLCLREKNPAVLEVEVVNRDSVGKLLSLSIVLPAEVAFDKTGLNRNLEKKLDLLKPDESKSFSFGIFPTSRADAGVFQGKLVVSEFAGDFDYLTSKYVKELFFRVVC